MITVAIALTSLSVFEKVVNHFFPSCERKKKKPYKCNSLPRLRMNSQPRCLFSSIWLCVMPSLKEGQCRICSLENSHWLEGSTARVGAGLGVWGDGEGKGVRFIFLVHFSKVLIFLFTNTYFITIQEERFNSFSILFQFFWEKKEEKKDTNPTRQAEKKTFSSPTKASLAPHSSLCTPVQKGEPPFFSQGLSKAKRKWRRKKWREKKWN